MAVKNKNSRSKKNEDIIAKVASVLDNTKCVTKLHIGIYADVDEIPTIRYSIEELIKPEPDYDEGYME